MVTVRDLLEARAPGLGLTLAAGARGLDRAIGMPRMQQPGLALAGFLPQLHPDRVQVLGNSEISYLGTLGPAAGARVAAVAEAGVACFVVTNGAAAPVALTRAAEAAGVAVLVTATRTGDFIRRAGGWAAGRHPTRAL